MATVPKQIEYGEEAREKTLEGVRKLNRAVAATLGPKGRNAMCERGFGLPTVTKDGVTVAKEINLPDPFEQMGNLTVREAASRTNTRAGDGTTTATILATAIMEEGAQHLGKGANPILIKKGIDRATKLVVEELKTHARDIAKGEDAGLETLKAIATISAAGDKEIGDICAQSIWDAGEHGIVSIEKSGGLGIEVENSDGMQFESTMLSAYMISDARTGEAIWENTPILVYEGDMNASREIIPLMEKLLKGDPDEDQPSFNRLVVICDNVANDALSAMVVNKMKGNFHTLAVRAPAYGQVRKEILKDIAILTGATLISKETGKNIMNVKPEDLGYARRVTADFRRCMIVDGGGEAADVHERILEIQGLLAKPDQDPLEEKILKERLASMTGKAVVLRVGAASEAEQKEKHYRVEDALCACRAAIAEGVLPGAGIPMLRAAEWLAHQSFENEHEDIGRVIVSVALQSPISWLAKNAGLDQDDIINQALGCEGRKAHDVAYDYGYDILNERWCSLLDSLVMDPMKVAREALENAASVAGTWLTLETAIVEIPPEGGDRINVVSPQEAMQMQYEAQQ